MLWRHRDFFALFGDFPGDLDFFLLTTWPRLTQTG